MLWGQKGCTYAGKEKENIAYEDFEYLEKEDFMSSRQVQELDSIKSDKYDVNHLYTFLYDYDRKNNGNLTHNNRFNKVVGLIKRIINEDKCSLDIDLSTFLLKKKF